MSKTPTNYNTVYLHVTWVPITCYCGFVLWSFEKYDLEAGEEGFFFTCIWCTVETGFGRD